MTKLIFEEVHLQNLFGNIIYNKSFHIGFLLKSSCQAGNTVLRLWK